MIISNSNDKKLILKHVNLMLEYSFDKNTIKTT